MEMRAVGKAPTALHAFADLGRAFRLWYERLVLSFVFASSWWAMGFIAAQLVLLVATPLMLLPASLIWALGALFEMSMANRAVHLEDFDIRLLFASMGRLAFRYIGLFMLSIGAFLLYLPVLLYLPSVGSLIAYIGFGLVTWVGLFSFVSVVYAAGIMVENDERLFKAMYKGFLLMIDNPAYSLTNGMLLLVLGVAGYILPIASMTWSSWAYLVLVVLGVFLYGSVNAYFVSFSVKRLLSRYGLARKSGREVMQEELLKK